MANLKTISQSTGDFIDDDTAEPGFIVNMDDPAAQAYIDRIKAKNAATSGTVSEAAPEAANFPVMPSDDAAATRGTESKPATAPATKSGAKAHR